jgi:hypothetical protein
MVKQLKGKAEEREIRSAFAELDSHAPKTAEERLIEWAKDLHFPDINVFPSMTSLGRLVTEVAFDEKFRKGLRKRNRDAARRKSKARTVIAKETAGVRMEIIDGVPCKPDGGQMRLLVRKFGAIEKSIRCRQVGHAFYNDMPGPMKEFVRVSYYDCAHYRDIPREAEGSAKMLGVSIRTYFRRKAEMLEWLRVNLGMPAEEEAQAA